MPENWRSSSDIPPLTGGDIHIWRCELRQPEERRQALVQPLSPEERQRGDKFYFEHHRRQWTSARGFLRAVLGRYIDLPAEQVRFRFHDLGKPALTDEQNAGNLHFNLSHSADGAVLAVARDLPLGIDLEQVRPMENMLALAKRYFAADEARQLEQVAAAHKELAFFNCWTRKEAILKACGKGLSLPLDRFVVSFLPGEPARVVEVKGQPGEAERWSLMPLQPWPDYVGCIAFLGTPRLTTCMTFV